MENKLIVTGYAIYLPIVIALTYFVAHSLFKNGRIFMLDIFRGRVEIATATNNLFRVGFYLLNLGFALLILEIAYSETVQQLIEVLSVKLGGFSIYLGIMLFANLFFFFRGKRKSKEAAQHQMDLPLQPE